MAANLSTKRCVGAREPWASSTAWMMRASVVLAATAVTRNSSAAVWLMVPANTWSPMVLSTGMLSPVTGAWSMALVPSVTMPSSGTRPPGRMRAMASSGTSLAITVFQLPSACLISACSGARASRLWMALRARSTARASMSSAMA